MDISCFDFIVLCFGMTIFNLYYVILLAFHQNWYAKTPLGKKRIKAATGKEEEEVPAKGKDAKKKKGKK